ncbi:AraC family transcriptional regulator [Nocardioides sp. NPDC047086]|uniref:AraC family transcriptional regulator n=1 Tax=Nocardioides sp. NPDC047086 TaxID=3154810 RepID=UPI0033CC9FDF
MIRTASLRGFASLVEELGGQPGQLLRRFGISPRTLASDDGLIPITAHDLMLDAAAAALDCPDLGLRLAERQDLSILGPLAIAVESSATVADALECASRFMFVHSPALRIGVEPDPRGVRGVVAATYRKDLRESPYSPQAMELGLGLFHHVADLLLGGVTGLRSVEIPHAPLSPVHRYLDFFRVDVKFGAASGALRLDRSALGRGFSSADETIRRIALEHLATHYPDPGSATAPRVRGVIAELLAYGAPGTAQVSRILGLHPRTLQRRLAREDTTFEALLDVVRREAAHRYITTTEMSLTQVAALSGFSEQSSLSRAVRRWYGTSPRDLRRGGATTVESG